MRIGKRHRLPAASGLIVAVVPTARFTTPRVHAQDGSHPPPIVSMSVLDSRQFTMTTDNAGNVEATEAATFTVN